MVKGITISHLSKKNINILKFKFKVGPFKIHKYSLINGTDVTCGHRGRRAWFTHKTSFNYITSYRMARIPKLSQSLGMAHGCHYTNRPYA